MSVLLKQSTAAIISFGPFLLNTDGVTLVINLVGTGSNQTENTSTGIRISKNGGAFAARHATATASTYDAFGNYLVTLDATDTNTCGVLRVQFANGAAFCPVWQDFTIVPAMIYDSLIAGTDRLDANVTHVADTAQTARDLGASVLVGDKTGFALTAGEHTNIAADAQTGLTAQGYTTTRAGYLDVLNGIVASIWASVARTLTAASDSSGITTLLARIASALTITGGKVDVNDKTEFALTAAERTAIANEVEAQIIDDTDSEKVLLAITNKIASVNPSLGSLTLAAIAAQVRTELSAELARIDVAISTRLATAGYVAPANSDITTLLGRLTSTRASLLDNLDALVSSRSTYAGADTSGTATLLARLSSDRADLLDDLALLDGAVLRLEKIQAAVYDSAAVDGNEITLSNGAVQTVTEAGRVTT